MDVVGDGEPLAVGSSGTTSSDVAQKPVLGELDLVGVVLIVVIRVDVEVDGMVAEVFEVVLATRLRCAAGVRWTHIGREETENVAESHLVLVHLVVAVSGGNGAQVQMGPCMRGNLVALGVCTLDNGGQFRGGVDFSLGKVVAGDEEGGFSVVFGEDVQYMGGVVLERAIIIRDRNCARSLTIFREFFKLLVMLYLRHTHRYRFHHTTRCHFAGEQRWMCWCQQEFGSRGIQGHTHTDSQGSSSSQKWYRTLYSISKPFFFRS